MASRRRLPFSVLPSSARCFLEAPQRVLSRDQLMDGAKHRMATGFDRAIDVQVSRLRRKIDASEEGQAMIKTIRGVG